MRISKHSITHGACTLLLLLLVSCHTHKRFTQTFVNDGDPSQSLELGSDVGFIRPAAEFPGNILFRLFGTEQLSGTYVLKTGGESAHGKFVAGREGTEQWIKFTSDLKSDWSVKVQNGGLLEASDGTIWRLKDTRADAEAATVLKIGR